MYPFPRCFSHHSIRGADFVFRDACILVAKSYARPNRSGSWKSVLSHASIAAFAAPWQRDRNGELDLPAGNAVSGVDRNIPAIYEIPSTHRILALEHESHRTLRRWCRLRYLSR